MIKIRKAMVRRVCTGTEGIFGGHTECIKFSGIGIEVFPNLRKCRVLVLRSCRSLPTSFGWGLRSKIPGLCMVVCSGTVRFFKMENTVRFGAVLRKRKSYGAVWCGFRLF